MSWDQLDLELAEMFSEYSGADERQVNEETWVHWRAHHVEYRRKWRASNKHRTSANAKRWRQKNATWVRAYAATPERKAKAKAATRRWRENNREHHMKLQRANAQRWRENNREKVREYMRNYMREYSKRKRAEARAA